MRVFHSAVSRDLHILEGRYLLADAGYEGATGLLTPYRGARYHLQEYGVINRRPRHHTELYNLRHSQLESIRVRTFKILTQALKDGITTTTKVIYATAGILNFMRGARGVPDDISSADQPEAPVHTNDGSIMAELREALALQMWDAYVQVLRDRWQCTRGFEDV